MTTLHEVQALSHHLLHLLVVAASLILLSSVQPDTTTIPPSFSFSLRLRHPSHHHFGVGVGVGVVHAAEFSPFKGASVGITHAQFMLILFHFISFHFTRLI